MDFRTSLEAELRRRRSVNPRYSLRAFSRSLRIDHGTLSRILRSERRVTTRSIRQVGKRLGLDESQLRAACLTANCEAILATVGDSRFRADARWIAMMTGIPLDDVSVALHWLLHTRRLVMTSRRAWTIQS